MLKEWPLAAFTIAGQTAVGVFAVFLLPLLVRSRLPSIGWRPVWLITLALVVLVMALAVIVSFFHLRHPIRARHVLSNLRTSWLSREILFELVFIALVALEGWLTWIRPGSRGLHWGVLTAACLAGGLFIISMAKLYMLPTLPVWSGAYTPLSFLLTTLVLGAMGTEIILRTFAGPGAFDPDLIKISLALVIVEILLAFLLAPQHGLCGVRPGRSLRPVDDAPRSLYRARIALLAAGVVFLVWDVRAGGSDIMNEKGPGPALLLAFGFILAGEVAGRLHFYGLVTRPGETA
jgi:anaerobic dimethyl sulfoxide reductase subunit C (anchor subunit)